MNKFTIVALVAGHIVACPVSHLEAAPLFRVTNLGTLGGDSSSGSSVNNLGHVVGGVNIVAGGQGYASLHDGNSWHMLGNQADALGKETHRINYYDDVIGEIPFGSTYIFTGGIYYYFNALGVALYDVNDNLVYVGTDGTNALFGNLGGSYYIVPAAGQPAFQGGGANAINNSGQVVGEFFNGPGFTRSAFFYQVGGGDPTLMPTPAGFQAMNPKAINELGAFTGDVNGAQTRAFVCNGVNSPVTVLPLIGNWTYSSSKDISDDGTVLGYGGTGTGITSAFLYQAGQMYLLANLVNGTGQGWIFEDVQSISPNGKYVTGTGRFNGQYRAFLLTAINPGEYILITKASLSGATFIMDFASDVGLTGWQIKASADLKNFTINKTGDSVITETYPGVYHVVVDLTGAPDNYFFRVEKP